jgi:hypothetical protein
MSSCLSKNELVPLLVSSKDRQSFLHIFLLRPFLIQVQPVTYKFTTYSDLSQPCQPVPACSNFLQPVLTYQNFIVPCSDLLHPVPTCSNLFQLLAPSGYNLSNLFQLVLTSWFLLVEINETKLSFLGIALSFQPLPTCSHLFFYPF